RDGHVTGVQTCALPISPRESPVRQAVQTYAEQHPALVVAARQTATLIGSMLDEAGINYLTIEGRAKSIASFAEKATRTEDGTPQIGRASCRERVWSRAV